MSAPSPPLTDRARHQQRGQALVLMAVAIVGLLGLAAFSIDVGSVLRARSDLQASSDAAATAGSMLLPDGAQAVSTANSYSGISGAKNAHTNLPNVSMASGYPLLKCLSSTGLACTGVNGSTPANAVVVRQQVNVPLYFARVLGRSTMRITATATAGMRGGVPHPLDIMLVLDTTGSMNNACSGAVPGVSNPTKLDCAMAGVRALLSSLWPCPQSLANCGAVTNGNVSNPVDKVGLMIFPGLKSATPVSKELDCSNNLTTSDVAAYNASPVYLIVPLVSDYRISDTASALNGANSNLVKAVDWTDGNTCASSAYGVESPGGVGTYFAAAITAAKANLVANGRSDAQDVIILLSDGDASAGTGGSNQCRGAITAAQTAATNNTWVYSIAYGAQNSGCSTDSPSISPLATMQAIANSPGRLPDSTKFYNQPTFASLTSIFQQIAIDLTTTRLLDDNTP
ncbi:MAG: pilus assembly protein TadG-related protein [Acidobacteriota bacterium]